MTDLSKYTGKELHDFLFKNKEILKSEKKYNVKCADAVSYSPYALKEKDSSEKAAVSAEELLSKDTLDIEVVINTTNVMDSHSDVHIPGLWKKSLQERKAIYLLQEHKMSFDSIISDDVEVQTKNVAWEKLGADYEGKTEALIFKATISRDRNPKMFEAYAKGWVKNHSVGMRYMDLDLAIDNKDYKHEKEIWDKYIDQIANRKEAEDNGYFWVVTQAKVIEGSAVPIGSNWITPTLSTKETETDEPPLSTQPEPSTDTQKKGLFENIGSKLN